MNKSKKMNKDFFNNIDYNQYCIEHNLHKLEGVNFNSNLSNDLGLKKDHTLDQYKSVNPNNFDPYEAEMDDLIRLHYLIQSRKVRTILEFGSGMSTSVFLDALMKNKIKYKDYVKKNLRNSNQFELHSIENIASWYKVVKKLHSKSNMFHPHFCPLEMGTFNDRICTYYNNFPIVNPDFIYLDGPDQFSAGGSVRGINTAHTDFMPMSADILAFEHFLEPGTLIVVDGRTANARFLKSNLQRNWNYLHLPKIDQHFFELDEEPLGVFNEKSQNFTFS